jgi:hypothetical protein
MLDVACTDVPEDFDVAPDPSAPFQLAWELHAVRVHASPGKIVDDVLRCNVYFLEFSEDVQALFLMPAFRLTQNDTFCASGLAAVPEGLRGSIERCTFALLRLRMMTFKDGDRVFVSDYLNPGCQRTKDARELFREEFSIPDSVMLRREEVLGSRCMCTSIGGGPCSGTLAIMLFTGFCFRKTAMPVHHDHES